ncbi:MAG: metacaspase [Pseudonocardiales bacterium]|nr:metacaspase [Pseudonocardiales bacterium]
MTDIIHDVQLVIQAIQAINPKYSGVVTVKNHSSMTIFRVHEHNDHGRFATDRADSIPPGGQDSFGVVSSENSIGTGCEGTVKYNAGGMGQAEWTVHWDLPFIGSASSDHTLGGAESSKYSAVEDEPTGGHDKVRFNFTLAGGPKVDPKPPDPKPPTPDPKPQGDHPSRCIITVTNSTQQVLTLVDESHQRGGFVDLPKQTIKPGESDRFVSADTQGVTDPAKKGQTGQLSYLIGQTGEWKLHWENPNNAQNTATGAVSGTANDSAWHSLAQIGEGDDNVPVAFTLSGGGGGGPHPLPPDPYPPEPYPPDPYPPEPDAEWQPPEEASGEPTLHYGDHGKDGWVEYAQDLLNTHTGANLPIDGNFADAMLQAVYQFQQSFNIQVDGVIGNQTWACLRNETPRPAGTDGRPAHSFEQTGPQGRWYIEGGGNGAYDPNADTLVLGVESTGEVPLDDFAATVRINGAHGHEETSHHYLGHPASVYPGGGAFHVITIEGIRATFGEGAQTVEAYLPADIGGDYTTFQFHV